MNNGNLLCIQHTSARPWWMNFDSEKRRKGILTGGNIKNSHAVIEHQGCVWEILTGPYYQIVKCTKGYIVVKWETGKG